MLLTRLNILLLLLALCVPLSPAQASGSCGLDMAAGLPVPKDKPPQKAGRFRIFWHIGTQIEQIADATGSPSAMADLRQAKDAVDGYYILGGMGGSLGYWPGRPEECVLNFKRLSDGEAYEIDGVSREFEGGGAALKGECGRKLEKSLTKQGRAQSAADVNRLQAEALGKAASVLRLTEESSRGKLFMVPVLFRNPEFAYDASKDTLQLRSLPGAYCGLVQFGVTPDRLMLYQENRPRRSVRIPRIANQKPSNTDFLPRNLRALSKVELAFDKAAVPLAGVSLNFRVWNRQMQRLVEQFPENRSIEGVNFEGSTRLLTFQTGKLNQIADGIAYILANTSYDISFLMPGFWNDTDLGTDEGIDSLSDRTRLMIAALDKRLRATMRASAGKSPLCTERIAFIPASYGNPVHPGTLPSARNGKWAGTVTGQIGLLNAMRHELCGQ